MMKAVPLEGLVIVPEYQFQGLSEGAVLELPE